MGQKLTKVQPIKLSEFKNITRGSMLPRIFASVALAEQDVEVACYRLFHTGHESLESPRIDFLYSGGGGGGGGHSWAFIKKNLQS